ncbi:hypothetical protein [Paenibacillus sp. YAF4_2]|uniref:hypothetical protein n=1 Tax=Paenibacillus sp. YAF4_2 TaxID=3233085 RepID=UPI003F9E3FE8
MTQQVEIRANFGGPGAAQEALRKLQALRAFEVNGLYENGLLTATVDEDVVERAVHMIEEIGGRSQTETIG